MSGERVCQKVLALQKNPRSLFLKHSLAFQSMNTKCVPVLDWFIMHLSCIFLQVLFSFLLTSVVMLLKAMCLRRSNLVNWDPDD